MRKSLAQIQAMKDEIQAWIERHGFQQDAGWHDLVSHYEGGHLEFALPHYLVLGYDGRLMDVLRLAHPYRDLAWQRSVVEEFRAILEKHGCWFEIEEVGIMAILDKYESATGDEQGMG
jgi:hypothetical protein